MTDRATKGTTEPDDSASALQANTAALGILTDLVRDSLSPPPALLTVEEVARELRVSKRTIWKLTRAGSFPQPVRIAGLTRWKRADVRLYIDRRGVWPATKLRRRTV